jgi:hypothetical protein
LRSQDLECLGTYLSFVVRDWIGDKRMYLPCNGLDLRDFAGIQQSICSAAERSPDIESDDEFSRGTSVKGTGNIHDG